MTRFDLVLRDVEVDGCRTDVGLAGGVIVMMGAGLRNGDRELDGRGGALIPGLCDHHLHILALATRADSIQLEGAGPSQLAREIATAAATRPARAWLRAVGYHEAIHGELTRADLDRLAPRHPLRVQHQTGALWVLNTLALAEVGLQDAPEGLDADRGWLWRGDAWLRDRLHAAPPPLAPIGRRMAGLGVTALTDASVGTDASAARLLGDAARAGALPQRLMLMSGAPLQPPEDGAWSVGPLKVLLDDHSLPPFDDFVDRVREARRQRRSVAVHCVTAGELALTLAVFGAAGAQIGDRIEHGGVIPEAAIAEIARLGLTVVTQSAFVAERGDRYLATVEPEAHDELYRCASLQAAGVPVAGSSDAPYASPDPWLGIRAAVRRRTAGGEMLGAAEGVTPRVALSLYLDRPDAPGRTPRRVEVGAPADLCLLEGSLGDVLNDPSAERVRATLVGGEFVYAR